VERSGRRPGCAGERRAEVTGAVAEKALAGVADPSG
jgi:hypothetical protein